MTLWSPHVGVSAVIPLMSPRKLCIFVENVFWILSSRNYFCLIIKINNFRGEATDISAKKEALVAQRHDR